MFVFGCLPAESILYTYIQEFAAKRAEKDVGKITSPHPQIMKTVRIQKEVVSKKCLSSPLLGEMIPIDEHIFFQMRKFNHPTR